MHRRMVWMLSAFAASAAIAAPLPKSEPEPGRSKAGRKAAVAPRTADKDAREDASVLRSFYSANGLAQRDMFDLAAEEYRAFLAAHGDHAKAGEARYGLGLCLYRLEKYAEAVEALRPIADHPPADRESDVLVLLGQSLLAVEKWDDAAVTLERARAAAKEGPRWEAAGAGAVEALFRTDKYREALKIRDEFATRAADSAWRDRVEWFAALAAVQSEQCELARERLAELVRDFPQSPLRDQARLLSAQLQLRADGGSAAETLRRLAEEAASGEIKAEALLGLAAAELANGNTDKADAALDRAAEVSPNIGKSAALRSQRARVRFAQERFTEALTEFEALAKGEGEIARESAYWVAKCHLRLGHDQVAAELFAKAGASDSASAPEAMYDMAVALSRAEKHAEVVRAANAFLAAHGEHRLAGDALALRAVAEYQLQDREAAAKSARELMERFSDHARAGDMLFLAADCAFLDEQYEEAATGFRRYTSSYPTGAKAEAAELRLAIATYRLGKIEEAREALERFVESRRESTERPAAVLLLADVYLQEKQWSRAAALLDGFASSGAASARLDEALLKLGVARQRMGEFMTAIGHYKRLVETFAAGPFADQATFEMGQCYAAQSQWAEARAAFETVLQRPDSAFHVPAKQQLAELAVRTGDFAAAAGGFRELRKASDRSSGDSDLTYREGEALLAAGDYAGAEKLLEQYLLSADARQKSAARAKLAIALSRQKKHTEAVAELGKMNAQSWVELDGGLRSALRFETAWSLRELKQPEKAAEAYRQIAAEAGDAEIGRRARLELAGLDMEAQRWAEAQSGLRELEKDLSHVGAVAGDAAFADELRYRLGVCAYRQGQFEEVVKKLSPWMEGNGENGAILGARFMLGDALLRRGTAKDALPHLKAAVGAEDHDLAAAALLRLGECHANLHQWDDSDKTYSDFLTRFPAREEWFSARFGMAWAQEQQGRLDEAMATYADVIARHRGPTAARAQFQIGECYFAKKEHEKAVREFMKVDILYAYPEWSAAALYEAGRCLELLGRTADARKQFETVQLKYPNTNWAKLAAERLTGREEKRADVQG